MMQATMMLLSMSLLLFQAAGTPIPLPALQPPFRDTVPNGPVENAALLAGNALYDQRKFPEAVARYEEALTSNPNSAFNLNQLADAYFQNKEYRKAAETAARGVEFRSTYLAFLYATLGNSFDAAGQPQDAVEVFRKGLALLPNSGTLYYNLAVTYQSGLKDPVLTRATLKQGAFADPNHSETHVLLAASFGTDDLKTPALLAVSRYLVLDAPSDRAAPRYNVWRQLLNGNTRAGENGQIQILINRDQKKDEGNLQILDADISMSKAIAVKTSDGKTPMQSLFEQIDSLFRVYSKRTPGEDKDKFVWTYYMPYFVEMQQRNFVEPFVYYVSQRTTIPGVREWLDTNGDRVKAFLDWSKNYSWPKQVP